MPKKVKSARGVTVDFDLLRIKEQISAEPAPLDVTARQKHIDSRVRRRLRNTKKSNLPTTPTTKSKPVVDVDASSPAVNENSVNFIDDVAVVPKQRAKPKQSTQD